MCRNSWNYACFHVSNIVNKKKERKKEIKPIKILDLLVCSDTGSGENNYSLGRESKAKSSGG